MSYTKLSDSDLRQHMRDKPFDKPAVYEAAARFLDVIDAKEVASDSYERGYEDGKDDGYDKGYQDGYEHLESDTNSLSE